MKENNIYSTAIHGGITCKGYPEDPFTFLLKKSKRNLLACGLYGDISYNGSWENMIKIKEESLCIM